MKLKKKYVSLNEPSSWYNLSGKKNVSQFGTGGGRNSKRSFQKKSDHPIGISGRALSVKRKQR